MIVIMRPEATEADIAAVCQRANEMGLAGHPCYGVQQATISIIGFDESVSPGDFSSLGGVDRVVRVSTPHKLASRQSGLPATAIKIAHGITVGSGLTFVAGPCSVESREHIVHTARLVKAGGASMLRAGAFKPRTSPYQFRGLGEAGLDYLAEAGAAAGLPVVTEVMTPALVEKVAARADVLQIGTRNMQNYDLLLAVGRTDKPVLLKRGMSATLTEFLLAAEYILSAGNPNVILCERGIRTFETHTRNTLDLSAVPALKTLTHLPVVVDPSHGTGRRELVLPMARAAVACGADGLLVEVHPDPDRSISDAQQAISPEMFAQLVRDCRAIFAALHPEAARTPV
ncbi:MAG: 3-deoxy-7-phosphoheptulonate synthase [Aphanocapsa lilacina HA4352-LM1]|jgi:3-deoxy-7-phosphoheptulonate synthase|nr:3-deoxy-7-phosphoheptulonate synthase [Aphanocapsa lilacina HA4352-LM1]